MAEIVVLIVVGAAIVALGLWVFSHLGGVLLVVGAVVVLGFALYLGAELLRGFGVVFDWIAARLSRRGKSDLQSEATALLMSRQRSSAEDDLVESLKRFRTDLARIKSRLHSEARAELKDDYARIAQAREFVKSAGLDTTLPSILKEVWHWPAWTKRPDAEELVHATALGLSDLEAAEAKTERGALMSIGFVFRGRTYRFEFENQRLSPDGTIRFFDGAELVIAMNVTLSGRSYSYDGWSFSSIETLKPSGEWIAALVEIEHNIGLNEEARDLSEERERVRQTAKGLPPAQSVQLNAVSAPLGASPL